MNMTLFFFLSPQHLDTLSEQNVLVPLQPILSWYWQDGSLFDDFSTKLLFRPLENPVSFLVASWWYQSSVLYIFIFKPISKPPYFVTENRIIAFFRNVGLYDVTIENFHNRYRNVINANNLKAKRNIIQKGNSGTNVRFEVFNGGDCEECRLLGCYAVCCLTRRMKWHIDCVLQIVSVVGFAAYWNFAFILVNIMSDCIKTD
jgi:hypothetical protein